MTIYLLDTNILIHMLRGEERSVRLVRSLLEAGHTLATCGIVAAEVYSGMRPKDAQATKQLLRSLRWFDMDAGVAEGAGFMRRDFSADLILTLLRRAWVFTFLGLSFTLTTVHVWTNVYSFVFFMFGAGIWLITAMPQTADTVVQPPASRHRSPAHQSPAAQGASPAYPLPTPGSGAPSTTKAGPLYTRFPTNLLGPQTPKSKDPAE